MIRALKGVRSFMGNCMGFNLRYFKYDDVTAVPKGRGPIAECLTEFQLKNIPI